MGIIKYLLDTHTLLWMARDKAKLGKNSLAIIENIDSPLFASAVSAYEIMFKHHLGKLPGYSFFAENYFDVLERFKVIDLPISTRHAHFAGKFEWTHRDPFDRLLAAQAFTENMILITNDSVFDSLPWLDTLW
jgi:PIN domain nuclease of toxin-antitoxin system